VRALLVHIRNIPKPHKDVAHVVLFVGLFVQQGEAVSCHVHDSAPGMTLIHLL
jgi:hypothetical protein